MKNKIFIALLILLNLFQFLLARFDLGFWQPTLVPVMGNPGERMLPLSKELFNKYRQGRGPQKARLERQITALTLQNLGLEQWLRYPDLKVIIREGDVYPTEGPEIFVAISAGKDNGLLAVYGNNSKKNYTLIDKIANLVPVTDLSFMPLPGHNFRALIVQEYLDEKVGAFFETSTITVFAWKKTLQKVWEATKFHEAVWNEKWLGRKPRWIKVRESARIRLLRPGQLQTVKETQFWLAPDSPGFPPPENFQQVEKETTAEWFQWDQEKFKFLPKK